MNVKDLVTLKVALEELYQDGIDAIRSASIAPDRITGVFRDGKKLYEFTLAPKEKDPKKQIFYKLQNPEVVKTDEDSIALPIRWDEAEGEWIFEGQVRSDGGEWQMPCAALDEGMKGIIRGIIEAL